MFRHRASRLSQTPFRKAAIAAAEGNSAISMEDFAVAMVDEIENPRHVRQQMTVAY